MTDTADDSPGPDPRVTPLLRSIRSRRTFLHDPPPEDDLALLLEAARWAPSTWNTQPAGFIIVRRTDTDHFGTVVASLSASNQRWAAHAPILIVVTADPLLENGAPNAHAWHDVGIACAFMAVQAVALGLHLQSMAGFRPEAARAAVLVPADHDVVTVLAVGSVDPSTSPVPPDIVARDDQPRSRRTRAEIVREGSWDRPYPSDPSGPSSVCGDAEG